jgi:inosine-uridine nucleoside N-ribohydrolase
VVKPDLIRTQHSWVGIETAGTLTRGMTVADLKDVWKHTPNAHVALDVDVPRFIDLLVGRIADLDTSLR